MALAAILRKSASSLARLARVNRSNHSAIVITSSHLSSTSFVPIFRFSSAVETKKKPSYDESLMQVIDSEIKCAVEQTDGPNRSEWVPSGFPFKIEDIPGQPTIILTREYQDELVKVEVSMPYLDPSDPEKPEDDFESYCAIRWGKVVLSEQDFDLGEQPKDDDDFFWEKLKRKLAHRCHATIPLVVTVTKNSGTSLKFSCTGYPDSGYPNTLSIHALSVEKSETSKDEMPYGLDFYYLEENFVKVFLRYLEIRGLEPATNNLLFELMTNKDSSEYLLWLKNVKNFIEA
ncbi:hypothetical protein EZV62_026226 [Acer yangbiense]|uniref:Mitochondrial glycoprotein n=1 Tax=Acer yangbiense TaxID=1000413 RepID=A0A5C7GRJ6_9ROSI|nr:hypothetical protein EZV62_026226 [Acer yangbiense]